MEEQEIESFNLEIFFSWHPVMEDVDGKNCNDLRHLRLEESGIGLTLFVCFTSVKAERTSFGDEYFFLLINPKDVCSQSKSLLQEVLNIYKEELPAMNYAANTGKESMFLERCVSNGKYCSLLLLSNFMEGPGKVIAAVTYQIIPADTQYAEIPLTAVSSNFQSKGIGRLLYIELRKRLQNVGIRTIFCWGDKESEGFWLKQGFVSIAEVDTKGRARRLPIRADIRRALCFPGGSTLMVSHLSKDISANFSDAVKKSFSLKPHEKSSSLDVQIQGLGDIGESLDTLKAPVQTSLKTFLPHVLVKDGFQKDDDMLDGSFHNHESINVCRDLVPFEEVDCNNMTNDVRLTGVGTDVEANCSCSAHGAKRGFGKPHYNVCFVGCSLGTTRNESLSEVLPRDILSSSYVEKNVEDCRPLSKDQLSFELQEKGEGFRIMLMNIADDTKKAHLTKIIKDLGGSVTSDGSACTHVVTGKVRKTLNFCTALCSGAWILSPSWLKESFHEGRFVDESAFILEDAEYLFKYRAEIKSVILRAKARPRALLKGYSVCLAPHVQPAVETLSTIVRFAGGKVIYGLDVVDASKTIFVACEIDMEEALLAVKKRIWTFSSEWFMNSIMRQELDFEAPQFAESL
ncbi:PAX-interacting protein 1 [Vitis vinifera]|uniref:PAX-interacting protein 1 n=1 Tax=Vitis vinifera TaxID=29760 RepID=A0A438DKL0_VITVI|nr:PAX-interacting protein 1 [Vitis vinifera]